MFFLDAKSSIDWTIYSIPSIGISGQPIVRDLAAICMAAAYITAYEYLGLFPGHLLWQWSSMVTLFYTSFISRIIDEMQQPGSSNTQMMRNAKAWPVVVFGLRYGALVSICGLAPTINAVTTLRFLKQINWISPKVTVEDSECFITEFRAEYLLVVASLFTLAHYTDPHLDRQHIIPVVVVDILIDWIFAIIILMYTNLLVYNASKLGTYAGEINFRNGLRIFANARAGGAVVPNTKPTGIGCAVLGLCTLLLLLIGLV